MVPMAPSATMTRVANWSRNSWARVLVDVVMWKRSQVPLETGNVRYVSFYRRWEGARFQAFEAIPRQSPRLSPATVLTERTGPASARRRPRALSIGFGLRSLLGAALRGRL